MMCNLPTDFLQTCRGSTNLAIHRRLAKFIDNRSLWLECELLKWLAKFFIFGMTTHLLAKGSSWLEMLLFLNFFRKLILEPLLHCIHKLRVQDWFAALLCPSQKTRTSSLDVSNILCSNYFQKLHIVFHCIWILLKNCLRSLECMTIKYKIVNLRTCSFFG